MIKAIRRTSLIDYPSAISSVIFMGGCDFKCKYCYNIDLVYKYHEFKTIPIDHTIDLLLSRKAFIDHIVVTGGEPTIHDLIPLLTALKQNGFKVKLDTNAHSDQFESLLEYVDYVAIDYKAPFHLYADIVGVSPNIEVLRRNFKAVKKVDHEFRSVIWENHPFLKNLDEIVDVIGSSKYYVQNIHFMDEFVQLGENEFNEVVNYLKSKNVDVRSRLSK